MDDILETILAGFGFALVLAFAIVAPFGFLFG
jgi:hypothetical protein